MALLNNWLLFAFLGGKFVFNGIVSLQLGYDGLSGLLGCRLRIHAMKEIEFERSYNKAA